MNGRRPRQVLSVGLFALVGMLAGCSSDGEEVADAKPTASTFGPSLGSGDSVLDPTQTSLSGEVGADGSSATVTSPPVTYVVPDIPTASVAEICAGTNEVVTADAEIGALVGPALAADASDEADRNLLVILTKLKPIIERAAAGYDRMGAALPVELASDARAVRDATLTFYGAVTSSQSMEGLSATITQVTSFSDAAKEAAARLDATTRKTCNKSLY